MGGGNAEDADVAAADAVEAWNSNQPRLQTTITKESRRHLQAQDHLVLHPPREGADTEAAIIAIAPQTHTKNGIIGIHVTAVGWTCLNVTPMLHVPGNAARTTIKRDTLVKNTRNMCKQDGGPAK